MSAYVLTLVLLVAALGNCQQVQPTFFDEEASLNACSATPTACKSRRIFDEKFPHIPSEDDIATSGHWSGVVPLRYDLNLNLSAVEKYENYKSRVAFEGSVTMLFKCQETTDIVMFNLNNEAVQLDVHSVSLRERCSNKLICISEIWLSDSVDVVTMRLHRNLSVGQYYELTLGRFSGRTDNNPGKGGLYIADFNEEADTYLISTLFQMRHAREVFPCIDHPSLKAKISLCLVHPTGSSAIGNTPTISSKVLPLNKTQTCFGKTPIIPTYVFTFGLTKGFDKVKNNDSVDPEIWLLVGKTGQASDFLWMLDEARFTANRMIQLTNESFMLDRIAFLNANPSPFWGIENLGLITVDAAWTRYPQYDTGHRILVHEIAHQWVGNLFTVRRWDEICLQEALTSALEIAIFAELGHPQESLAAREAMVTELRREALRRESDYFHPIIRPFGRTQQIADECFQKAPLLFLQLAQAGPPDTMQRLLTGLAHKHRFANAGVKEYASAAEEAVNGPWGAHMLQIYFTQPGYPLLRVDYPYRRTIRVKQWMVGRGENITDFEDDSPYRLFVLPIEYLTSDGDSGEGLMTGSILELDVPDAAWHLLDPRSQTMSRVIYEVDVYSKVADCLREGRQCTTDASCSRRHSCPRSSNATILLGSHEAYGVFADFCWALRNDLLREPRNLVHLDHWQSLVRQMSYLTSQNRSESRLDVGRTCNCCFKTKAEIEAERPSPWTEDCLYSWNNVCSELKIMKALGLDYKIDRSRDETEEEGVKGRS